MTNILYRSTSTPTTPVSTTVKGVELNNAEIDGNFKSLSDDIGTKANIASPTFTGTVSGISGSMISNTPAGNIASTTVQAALNELDSEKVAIGGVLGTPTSGTATNLTGLPLTTGVIGTLPIANGGTSSTTAGAALIALGERTGTTGTLSVPSGTTAQRATTLGVGIRYSTTLSSFEGYNGTSWGQIGGGATGAGGNSVFVENDQIVTADYTLTANKNAMSAGPITINTGITVTIPTGATWSVV